MQIRTEIAIWLVASHVFFGLWVVLYFIMQQSIGIGFALPLCIVHLSVLIWLIRHGTPKMSHAISTYVLQLLLSHKEAEVPNCVVMYQEGGFVVVTEEHRVVCYFIEGDRVEVSERARV